MDLPAEVWTRCAFTPFPYVTGGDSGVDAVNWAHEEAVEQLRAGAPHPQRAAVLEWARLAREHDESWNGLTDAERETVLALDRGGAERSRTAAIDRHLDLGAELEAVYYEQLRPGELAKIRRALHELRAWLDGS
jgi:hypothetical protein